MDPTADRPHMPGHGVGGPGTGTGLLPWSWALKRIAAGRDFWVATVTPQGGPHVMPVWGCGTRTLHDGLTGSPTRWTFDG